MKKTAFPIRIIGLLGMVTLLALIVLRPVGASPSLVQGTAEPTVRPTPTPSPMLELNPTQGVAGDATEVLATGARWVPDVEVTLYWDDVDVTLGTAEVNGEGEFEMTFVTPTDPAHATVGPHAVIAVQGDAEVVATFELLLPTPTHTPSATPTSTATGSPTPVTPSPTPSETPTLTPSPTLRPVTPMVTISPIPPTRPPAATKPPKPTRTNTPVPGTPTNTLTPSVTPTPSHTPGPGTPSATPPPMATAEEEISDTGSGVGMIFLWGFVLAGLLVVFRLLRVRSLPG